MHDPAVLNWILEELGMSTGEDTYTLSLILWHSLTTESTEAVLVIGGRGSRSSLSDVELVSLVGGQAEAKCGDPADLDNRGTYGMVAVNNGRYGSV